MHVRTRKPTRISYQNLHLRNLIFRTASEIGLQGGRGARGLAPRCPQILQNQLILQILMYTLGRHQNLQNQLILQILGFWGSGEGRGEGRAGGKGEQNQLILPDFAGKDYGEK